MGAPTKSLVAELKKKAARAKSLLEFYNPDKYPASVLYYRKDAWPLKVETAQIDIMEALFNLTESMDGVDNQEDIVECEEIVKNLTEEAIKFTIQFNLKLLSHSPAESGLPPAAAPDEARAAVIEDQDKLDNDLKDPVAEAEKIDITTDPEVAEENPEFGCEVKDSMKADTVRHRLGDQAFVTFNGMFSASSGYKELSAESKFGYYGLSMLCHIKSCSIGPDFVIMDIVKPFTFITRSKSVAMVSAAATHGDHTDRTGIGGECRYEEKLDFVTASIAFTADLACLDNYCARIVSSSKNIYVYIYTNTSR